MPTFRLHHNLLLAGAFLPLTLSPVEHDLSGVWEFEQHSPTAYSSSTFTLTQTDAELRGDYRSGDRERIVVGRVAGDSVSLEISVTSDIIANSATITYRGAIVDADSLRGTVEAKGRVIANFTAVRRP